MDFESIDWGNQCYTLDEFLHTFTLPKIVYVRDGYLDLEEITTLSTDQIMTLHFLKRCKILKGHLDKKPDEEISIPLNTGGTMEILLEKPPKVYKSIKQIKKDMKVTRKVMSLQCHASLGIRRQDVLQIEYCVKQKCKEVLRCSVVNRNHAIVEIPTSFKASFLSYEDYEDEEPIRKIPISEAPKQCSFPCLARIHGRSPTKPDFDPEDSSEYFELSDLGCIKLLGVYDYDKIIASTRHLEKVRIMQFPVALPITVSTGKDVNNEDSMYNQLCRDIHQGTQFQQMDGVDYEYIERGYSQCKVDNIYEYIDPRPLNLPDKPSRFTESKISQPSLSLPPILPQPELPKRVRFANESSPSLPSSPLPPSLPPSSPPPILPKPKLHKRVSSAQSLVSSLASSTVPSSLLSSSSTHPTNTHQESYEIPDDLKSLTVEGVANCLKHLHMGNYAGKFTEELIDGAMLAELSEEILENSLGVTNSLHRKKILKFIQGWRPKSTSM